jgi:hypothetical protein
VGKNVGGDEQDVARHPGAHHGSRHAEAVDEAAARCGDIEGRRLWDAEVRLDGTGRRREGTIRGTGRQNDQVDRRRRDSGGGDGAAGGRGSERRGALARRSDAPLADAGAGRDPFVGCIHHPFQVGVG